MLSINLAFDFFHGCSFVVRGRGGHAGELIRGLVVAVVYQRKHWNLSRRETWVQMPAQPFTPSFLGDGS